MAAAAAHDLNDELTVILSSVGCTLEYLAPGHPARRWLLEAKRAVQRCAWKTSSLLSFSAREGGRRAATPMEALMDDDDGIR